MDPDVDVGECLQHVVLRCRGTVGTTLAGPIAPVFSKTAGSRGRTSDALSRQKTAGSAVLRGRDSPVWGTDSTGPDDDETFTKCLKRALRSHGAPELPEGGESMSFKDLVLCLRARYGSEEGQTMAEYGVVLAVIAIGVVVALGLLSTSISGAIDSVRSNL